MAGITTITDEALIAIDTIADRAAGVFNPTLRLGVTGLSRAGKTVFITALVHNLLHRGRLPVFDAMQSGRIADARLAQQPDDTVPRFQYEDHVRTLVEKRLWPDSTRSISELRLTLRFESRSAWSRLLSAGQLTLDIIDYPGEWLLDLPLLGKTFREFSDEAFELSNSPVRTSLAARWHEVSGKIDPSAPFEEPVAARLHQEFTAYLRACRDDERALSMLPPGRFLMPGDLEGTPAITFAPLPGLTDEKPAADSLHAIMERRYEAYKAKVVKPFFREHIARLDRQIVLVDAMQALNAGTEAVSDLSRALTEILGCFRPGRGNLVSSLFSRSIDRVLVAATKADHLHHESHDKLEAIVRALVANALEKAGMAGAGVDALAMAAIRATREGNVEHGSETLPVIIGTPLKGERLGKTVFDGRKETAVFPGDLPDDPESVLQPGAASDSKDSENLRFVRFAPPALEKGPDGKPRSLPHIRLDRAMEFLIGDYLE